MLPEPMLVDGIIATRAQIDFLWQFFITVHIAIFALLLIYDDAVENLNFIARALALGYPSGEKGWPRRFASSASPRGAASPDVASQPQGHKRGL